MDHDLQINFPLNRSRELGFNLSQKLDMRKRKMELKCDVGKLKDLLIVY